MTYRPTEYIVMKRLLYAAKDYTDRIDGTEANAMIYDSVQNAFDDLDKADKARVASEAKRLSESVKGLSHNGALELLAAIGDWIGNNGNA